MADFSKYRDEPADPEGTSYYQSDGIRADTSANRRTKMKTTWLYTFMVCTLAAGWVVAFGLYVHQYSISKTCVAAQAQLSSPIPPAVFQRVKRVFQKDERYMGPSRETSHHWDKLITGHDSLWIEDPDSFGLPAGTIPPFEHPNMSHPLPHNFYVISIFHSMHCLNMIRTRYWLVKLDLKGPIDYSEEKWAVHTDHCFEYLRQTIACGSDMIIEGASPLVVEGQERVASTVTGWGVEHECLNIEALRVFQHQQEQAYNATWGDRMY